MLMGSHILAFVASDVDTLCPTLAEAVNKPVRVDLQASAQAQLIGSACQGRKMISRELNEGPVRSVWGAG